MFEHLSNNEQFLLRRFMPQLQTQTPIASHGILVPTSTDVATSIPSITTTLDPLEMESTTTINHLVYYAIGVGIVIASVYLITAHQRKKQEEAMARRE